MKKWLRVSTIFILRQYALINPYHHPRLLVQFDRIYQNSFWKKQALFQYRRLSC